MTNTPASNNRVLAARIAAHSSWASTPDRAARTAAARDAFRKRFEDEVDPDRTLPEDERAARAENARHAYYLRMAAKSVESRRRNAKAKAKAAKKVPVPAVPAVPTVEVAEAAEAASDDIGQSETLEARVRALAEKYAGHARDVSGGGAAQSARRSAYLGIAAELEALLRTE